MTLFSPSLFLLEPTEKLHQLDLAGDNTARLALMEEIKTLPFATVWDEHCAEENIPAGMA